MKNNADKLLTVCDALLGMKEASEDMDAVLQQLISARDALAAVLNEPHPDDDQETTAKLKAGYENIVAAVNALESVKVK